jgi:hypothetical protein
MSSHVEIIVVGGFSPEKEVIAKELEGQPHQASWILTFSLSKASPGACRSYLTVDAFIIYACKCIVHLCIGVK